MEQQSQLWPRCGWFALTEQVSVASGTGPVDSDLAIKLFPISTPEEHQTCSFHSDQTTADI